MNEDNVLNNEITIPTESGGVKIENTHQFFKLNPTPNPFPIKNKNEFFKLLIIRDLNKLNPKLHLKESSVNYLDSEGVGTIKGKIILPEDQIILVVIAISSSGKGKIIFETPSSLLTREPYGFNLSKKDWELDVADEIQRAAHKFLITRKNRD